MNVGKKFWTALKVGHNGQVMPSTGHTRDQAASARGEPVKSQADDLSTKWMTWNINSLSLQVRFLHFADGMQLEIKEKIAFQLHFNYFNSKNNENDSCY